MPIQFLIFIVLIKLVHYSQLDNNYTNFQMKIKIDWINKKKIFQMNIKIAYMKKII